MRLPSSVPLLKALASKLVCMFVRGFKFYQKCLSYFALLVIYRGDAQLVFFVWSFIAH